MHQSVLYKEIIHVLRPARTGKYIDGTLGAGGHAFGLLEASAPDGRLLGFDRDPDALELARERLAPFGSRAVLRQASYINMEAVVEELGWGSVDGILLDLGVSSMQFDRSERGFSFREDAPLDMRFDPTQGETAADLVNTLSETELADILYRYGEERRSRAVARAIIRNRPVSTTGQLAKIVAAVTGGGKVHPATRTFQALRIATNRELEAVESVLPQAVRLLSPGGRLAVISFHSLEDRIVKQYFRRESKDCICPPEQLICICDHVAVIEEVNRKPIRPGPEEVEANPRARSALLRVAEKLENV